jgi:hypothetical protein
VVAPAVTQGPASPLKPEGVPDKFWDPKTGTVDTAGMARAYTELEKAYSRRAEKRPANDKSSNVSPTLRDAARQALGQPVDPPEPTSQNPGLTPGEGANGTPAAPQRLTQEQLIEAGQKAWNAETQTLSDDFYTLAEQNGVPRTAVDAYVAGMKANYDGQVALHQANVAAYVARLHKEAGGEQQLREWTSWGTANLSPEEQSTFNQAMTTMDMGHARMALAALKARYVEANGTQGTLLVPNQAGMGPEGVDGGAIRDASELTALMKDSRYTSDPKFRQHVEARVRMSMRMGGIEGLRVVTNGTRIA